jgi:hypothetical protein
MTAPEPEKQYIITESQSQDLHAMLHISYEQRGVEILQQVHSHPLSALLEAERNRVLDELICKIDNTFDYGGNKESLFHYTGLHCMIDSLRSSSPQQPAPLDVLESYIQRRIDVLTDARDNEFRLKEDIAKAQYGITQLRIIKSEIDKFDNNPATVIEQGKREGWLK